MRFVDRNDAGRRLAGSLQSYAHAADLLVLGLARGGVVVAYEVARALKAPLDVYVVRKLGVPGDEELAMGAIASGGIRVLNEDLIRHLHISDAQLADTAEAEQRELERREQAYRGGRQAPGVAGHTVLLVDDGLATGVTMLSAVRAIRTQKPARVVVAVPTASPDAVELVQREADAVLSLITPPFFQSVGQWYLEFAQVSDAEVCELLEEGVRS